MMVAARSAVECAIRQSRKVVRFIKSAATSLCTAELLPGNASSLAINIASHYYYRIKENNIFTQKLYQNKIGMNRKMEILTYRSD